jgi:oligopeptide transport system ATP-binding protein
MAGNDASTKTTPLLSVRDLWVRFKTPAGEVQAVEAFSLDVARGETVGIVGESGSGKSQAMMAVMGLLAGNGRAGGSVRFDGREILGAPASVLNTIRGTRLTVIFQEPMSSLDPLTTVGHQIAAPLRHHRALSAADARARAIALLDEVRVAEPERRVDAHPHELSGGQRQRVMIAMALANDPDLLIADEPTTALDVTVEAEILRLLDDLRQRRGLAVVLISHDLALVRGFAARTLVMRAGRVVEEGPTQALFDAPEHPYTRALIKPMPKMPRRPVATDAPVLVAARDVSIAFETGPWLSRRRIVAVDRVSLRVRRGETLGIVGESGSGKTTLGRALLRLVPATGEITFEGRPLLPLDRVGMRPLRRHMQIVYQDPQGSLSPRMTAGEIVTEGLLVHEPSLSVTVRDRRAAEAFAEVGLDPLTRWRFPHEFSGGQRQRIAIARAMILRPQFLVLDEPTSALDRAVQAEIVALLERLQAEHGLTYVFISHDLSVIEALSDRILVMRAGRVVEEGTTQDVLQRPRERYTQELVAAALG